MPTANSLTKYARILPLCFHSFSSSRPDRPANGPTGSCRSLLPGPITGNHHVDPSTLLKAKVTVYLDEQTTTDLFCHPVTVDECWSLWGCKLGGYLEARGYTYNPTTLTLQVKHISVGLHNAGWLWLSNCFDAMIDDGFIAHQDLAQKARGIKNPVGLIVQAENKGYCGFGWKTAWKDMHRTPDWSLYRLSSTLAGEKPCMVMEIGVSQDMWREGSKPRRELLRDRAEAWLLATEGMTKAVILVSLSKVKTTAGSGDNSSPDDDTVEDILTSNTCINVNVQLWRLSASFQPMMSESHSFIVRRDSESWEDVDVPEDFPEGVRVYTSDIYEEPAEERSFLLPLTWLREGIIGYWGLHVEAAEDARTAGDMVKEGGGEEGGIE